MTDPTPDTPPLASTAEVAEHIDALRNLMGRMRVHGDDLAVMLANDSGLPSVRESVQAKWRDAVNETYELLAREANRV